MTLLNIILGALGLSFLVFIHELGHYVMAKRTGMKVEVFSIGFGPAIYKWQRGEVRWQICWCLFGGYVKIKGMEKEGSLEPYEVPEGFYSKRPRDRILVAVMGPVVNIVFAFLAFVMLWLMGGRDKTFSELTHIVGWVEPKSALSQAGLQEGDEIFKLGGQPYEGYQSLLISSIMKEPSVTVTGEMIDYYNLTREPLHIEIENGKVSPLLSMIPARYVIYNEKAPLGEKAPMADSGIDFGDRIVWADGELVFSLKQMVDAINGSHALVTVKRGGATFLTRVPRVKVRDMRLHSSEIEEFDDWQHEIGIKGDPQELYFTPYVLDNKGYVRNTTPFIDEDLVEKSPQSVEQTPFQQPLKTGDRIIAVDGAPVKTVFQILRQMQQRQILLIVQKEGAPLLLSSARADANYINGLDWSKIAPIVNAIGTKNSVTVNDGYRLLGPVTPVPLSSYAASEGLLAQLSDKRKEIEKIKDPKERREAMRLFESGQNRLVLGINPQDAYVIYNPAPQVAFVNVITDTYRTLIALFSNKLSPKYLSGPVGIVHASSYSWGIGFKEAIYWLAVISLNLGLLKPLARARSRRRTHLLLPRRVRHKKTDQSKDNGKTYHSLCCSSARLFCLCDLSRYHAII